MATLASWLRCLASKAAFSDAVSDRSRALVAIDKVLPGLEHETQAATDAMLDEVKEQGNIWERRNSQAFDSVEDGIQRAAKSFAEMQGNLVEARNWLLNRTNVVGTGLGSYVNILDAAGSRFNRWFRKEATLRYQNSDALHGLARTALSSGKAAEKDHLRALQDTQDSVDKQLDEVELSLATFGTKVADSGLVVGVFSLLQLLRECCGKMHDGSRSEEFCHVLHWCMLFDIFQTSEDTYM